MTDGQEIRSAYIEILGAVVVYRQELTNSDLSAIGEFTKENILRWIEYHLGNALIGILPVEDFHAVSGDVDLPWATKRNENYFLNYSY
jgi:hypothetical protein